MERPLIIDDFLPNFSSVQRQGIHADYTDWAAPDGQVYKRICITDIPGLQEAIEEKVGPVEMLGMGFRLNYEGEPPNQAIHTDLGWGTHALVLYLRDGPSGTAFWKHNKTNTESINVGQVELLEQIKADWEDESKWRMDEFVGMRANRALIYPSELYHSRYPFKAFGNTPETGRLIVVAFFNKLKGEVMLRAGDLNDLPRLVQMGEKFRAATYHNDLAPFNLESIGFLARTIVDHGIMIVAEVDKMIVGALALMPAPYMMNSDYIGAYEAMLWVEPDYQDGGIGKSLIEAGELVCRNKGIDFIQMAILPNSPPKIDALFRSFGYLPAEVTYVKRL